MGQFISVFLTSMADTSFESDESMTHKLDLVRASTSVLV